MNVTKLSIAVPSPQTKSYSIVFGNQHWKKTLREFLVQRPHSKVGFIVDEQVFSLWQHEISSFENVEVFRLSSGEQHKTMETVTSLIHLLIEKGFDRKSLIVAMGGGVTGDVAGFVASLYMRGIGFVQIPTTVLAMVDSSIGGKTGVDTPAGKNIVGSFHFPELVITDTQFLQTLPEIQKRNGLVEMVKHALIADKSYYEAIINALPDEIVQPSFLWKSCQIKADIVRKDPREKNLRQILNFGHTMGHAIEHALDYEMLHGFAVAWGIVAEVFISNRLGYLRQKHLLPEIISSLKKLHLLQSPEKVMKLAWDKVAIPLLHDKKNTSNQVRVVLIDRLGHVKPSSPSYSHPVQESLLKESFAFIQKLAEDIYAESY